MSNVSRALNDALKQRIRLVHALVFCLAVLPACLHLVIVLKYGVNVPYNDDWSRVGLFQETSQDTLSFGDLIAQNNESRPFFPNLISIALAFLTNWDVRYEMLVTVLLACLVSFNIYRLGKLTIDGSLLKRLSIFFLSNLFIFAPIQAENWLRGIQIIVFMPIACITTCLSVAYSGLGTRTKFLICMILSTISTFSYANGMLCWVLVLPVLVWSRSWSDLNRKKWLISGWVAGFVLNVALYFHDYQKPPQHPDLSEALGQPAQALQYSLSFLGAPYSHGLLTLVRSTAGRVDLATISGAVLLLLFVSSCVYLLGSLRNFVLVRQSIGWLMIGAYSIISALVTTFGRLGFGVEQSIFQRYTTFSLYLTVSLIYLIAIIFSDITREGNPSRSRLFVTVFGSSLITPIVLLHLATFVYWPVVKIPDMALERSKGKACLLLINVVRNDECLTKEVFEPGADILPGLATTLNEIGFLTPALIEGDKVRDIEGAKSGSATYGEFGALAKTDEGSYLASGWAISPEEGRPADAVLLTYEDANGQPTVFAVTDAGKRTRDAAKDLRTAAYARSGWEETFSTSVLPSGSTKIGAWVFDANTGRAFRLDGTHVLEEPR